MALVAAPLGSAYAAMRGGAMLLVWPVGLMLGEPARPLALFGAVVTLVGLISLREPARATQGSKLGWAYVCAVFIASYHLCYAQALKAGAHPIALITDALGVALLLNLFGLGRRGVGEISALVRKRPLLVVLAGVLCFAGFFLFLLGLGRVGMGAAITLRNSSLIFAQVFGALMGEYPGLRAVGASALIAVGVTLVSWP
jgi:drug/metabolite transporter (DMT)-like permease